MVQNYEKKPILPFPLRLNLLFMTHNHWNALTTYTGTRSVI